MAKRLTVFASPASPPYEEGELAIHRLQGNVPVFSPWVFQLLVSEHR